MGTAAQASRANKQVDMKRSCITLVTWVASLINSLCSGLLLLNRSDLRVSTTVFMLSQLLTKEPERRNNQLLQQQTKVNSDLVLVRLVEFD